MSCGCKGVRTCYICDEQAVKDKQQSVHVNLIYWYCPTCSNIYQGDVSKTVGTSNNIEWCELHQDSPTQLLETIKGIYVEKDFITPDEERYLVEEINKEEWKLSQSGRKKQDFGPKVNFKRRKVKSQCFTGLPSYSKFLTERIHQLDLLSSFIPVELCNLEYTPERGSSIDPHIDDTWLWGEHLVTINLLSTTILTLTKQDYQNEIQIPISARSLLVLHDDARYKWMHSIKPLHITCKRMALTLRNLSDEFGTTGVNKHIGDEIIDIAQTYQGTVVK